MGDAKNTKITIRFDGLFLLSLDKDDKSLEARINTAAKGHQLKITLSKYTLKKNGSGLKCQKSKPIIREGDLIKSLHPISIFIGDGDKPKPIGNSAKGRDFNKILDLEGKQFYHRRLSFRRKDYGASVHLNNGLVEGAETVTKAYRIKDSVFDLLNFERIKRAKWDELVKREQAKDPSSIKKLGDFASDAKARLDIKPNQKLWIISGKKRESLFEPLHPLNPGEHYELMIEYKDEMRPRTLAECLGFANHCKSLKLIPGEPVFCIFRPKFQREKGIVTEANTISGICMSARIDPEE